MLKTTFRIFFRKGQETGYLFSKIALVVLLLINAISELVEPFKDLLEKNGITRSVLWATAVLITVQLDSIIAKFKTILSTPFSKRPIDSASDIINKASSYDNVNIYVGNYDARFVGALIEKLKAKSFVRYYINHRLLNKFSEAYCFRQQTKFYVSDVPKDSVVVMYFNSNVCEAIDIIRPYRHSKYYCVEVRNDPDFLSAFQTNYSECYEGDKNAFRIKDALSYHLVAMYHEVKLKELISLYEHQNLNFQNRNDFFEFASAILKCATTSLHAFDFISPEAWLNDTAVIDYAKAHAVDVPIKKRIHVYNMAQLSQRRDDYLRYMEVMQQYGVELLFLDETKFDPTRHEKRGALIIDSGYGVIAINPREASIFGEIELNKQKISDYNKRFNAYEPKCISATRFKEILSAA